MKLYRLERRQILPTDLSTAWTFFSNPRNLPLITPPNMGFRLTCDLPGRMHPGMIISYRLMPFPLFTVTWVTEITHVEEPEFFVDEQRAGPYRLWHHQHHFRSIPGGVETRDLIHYLLPFGPPGRLAAPLVRRQLAGIFAFRQKVLAARFGGTTPTANYPV